jgi:hypothetical protein
LVRLARLVVLGEELKSGEATNAVLGGDSLVLSSIEFSDDDVRANLVGEFFVGGSHANTVAAPRSEELDHDVLVLVQDDFVEVVSGELNDFSVNEDHSEDGDESDDELEHFLFFYTSVTKKGVF